MSTLSTIIRRITALFSSHQSAPVPLPAVVPIVPPLRVPMLVGVGTHGSPNEAAQCASLGTITRITYSTVERAARGEQYDAEFAARLVDLRGHGLDVLVLMHDMFGIPYASIVPLVAQIAARHPGTTWQYFNEADAKAWYLGDDYAGLMAQVVPAVKAFDPTCRVVGMGLACTDGQPWGFKPDQTRQPAFLRDYLAANGPTLDAWCLHCYGAQLDVRVQRLVEATQAVLGDRMPLWITECGIDDLTMAAKGDTDFDPTQAELLTMARIMAMSVGVARFYAYVLWSNDDTGFGFLRADAVTERPVCAAWRGDV